MHKNKLLDFALVLIKIPAQATIFAFLDDWNTILTDLSASTLTPIAQPKSQRFLYKYTTVFKKLSVVSYLEKNWNLHNDPGDLHYVMTAQCMVALAPAPSLC